MPKFVDRTGHKYGRLTVVGRSHRDRNRHWHWMCECQCGTRKTVSGLALASGGTSSCGCLHREVSTARLRNIPTHMITGRPKVHGKTRTPEHRVWANMRERCTSPRHKAFKYYGARGIVVCDRWMTFENFYSDMGDRPSDKHTLERVDVNGGYHKDNCRWATTSEQARNKRNTVKVGFEPLVDVAKNYSASLQRIADGWPSEDAVSIPIRVKLPVQERVIPKRPGVPLVLECCGRSMTVPQWSRATGIPAPTIHGRIASGWSIERALTQAVLTPRRA